jgi:hypothetical protein
MNWVSTQSIRVRQLHDLFAEAVKILDGKTSGRRGKKAAMEWLMQIDLRALDVTTLPGVGPHYSSEWAAIKETSMFARLFQQSGVPSTEAVSSRR